MVGKQGILRIVEAFIAIMIIGGVMTFIYVQKVQKPSQEEFIKEIEQTILKEISNKQNLREYVINGEDLKIKEYIADNKLVPPGYEINLAICALEDICGLASYPPEKEVFSNEVSISSTLESGIKYKKIRIFMWEAD